MKCRGSELAWNLSGSRNRTRKITFLNFLMIRWLSSRWEQEKKMQMASEK